MYHTILDAFENSERRLLHRLWGLDIFAKLGSDLSTQLALEGGLDLATFIALGHWT